MFRNRFTPRRLPRIHNKPPRNQHQSQPNEYERNGTISDRRNVTIGLINAFLTFSLILAALYQNHTSNSALRLAHDEFDSTIAASKADDKRADSLLSIQKQYAVAQAKSVDAQLALVNEMKGEFVSENQPVIEANNFLLTIPQNTMEPSISFDLVNSGKKSVYVTKGRFGWIFPNRRLAKHQIDNLIDIAIDTPYKTVLAYLVPTTEIIYSPKFFSKEVYNNIIAGNVWVVLIGQITYINPISHKKAYYRFATKFTEINKVSYETWY